ncbi:MAG: NAD(P)H-dependent flavin oxidoreductase [Gammaproteobacteria bacterium]
MPEARAGAELCRRLGLDLPLLQAPMAGVQDAALALAVANAGALGAVPAAMLDGDGLERTFRALDGAGADALNVNFFCHETPPVDASAMARWRAALAPYYAELGVDPAAATGGPARTPFDADAAALVRQYRPAVVSFHFGLPAPALLGEVRAAGALVLSSATTVAEARWLAGHGVDAVIAQGLEAGGHRGHFLDADLSRQAGTFALLPQVVAAVDVPVIAAGGIADAAGVAAALRLGAAAVQVGTAFLCAAEATTSAVHRQALAAPGAAHTALTNVFSGRPARGIVNRAMRELGPMSPTTPAFPLATGAIAPLRAAAEALGSGEFSPLWAGQNARGCRAAPAAEIVGALAAGFD